MIIEKKEQDPHEQIDDILNPLVKEWFYSRFRELSLPQRYAVLDIHSRKNVLVSAPTGATKTLTAFLSILNELTDSAQKGILDDKVCCIYVSPLKALNYDIEVNLTTPLEEMEELLGRRLGIRVAVRTGDTTSQEKTRMLRKPPHILITTPESLAILLSSAKFVQHIRHVEWMIVDEIHALAENKRGAHLSLTMERLEAISPGMARIGLSATVAPIDEMARFLVGYNGAERDCVVVNVPFIKKMDLKVVSPVKSLITSSHDEKQKAMFRMLHELIQEHTTTLVFTNTRATTERVVNGLKELHPAAYNENIGAHHGSLSKEHRRSLEKRMRQGSLKAVVSSTSLELGIDIGFIDLVVLLGSPKSVARALQRIGRSGHKLHETTKGRIIVLDRDDLVECSVLLRNALAGKVDRISIPRNCLDVLAQHIYGISIERRITDEELFALIRKSYSYNTLSRTDFNSVLDYLSGEYIGLEERNVYAKIWHSDGMIGRKGRMARVLYMTNVGTIPDEAFITVKVGNQPIGQIDEAFLERLRRGDVFVLGGDKYEFLYAKGTVAYVNASVYRPPSVPSWISEMLPLSFDLANDIGLFRRLLGENLSSRKKAMAFLNAYLSIDDNSAAAIYEYVNAQKLYAALPSDKRVVIEHHSEGQKHIYIFHALFGRRVNDALSRAFAYAASRVHHRDFEIGISDNGFYIAAEQPVKIKEVVKVMLKSDFNELLKLSLEKTEILRRRFRHVATRGLMILRNYMGKTKKVGRQQVSSMLLLNAVQRLGEGFPLLKEAKREVLDDMMDRQNAKLVMQMLKEERISVEHIDTPIPSPFAFNLVVDAHLDLLRIEDKLLFLKKMHFMVMAKISLDKKKGKILKDDFCYEREWGE